jgi:hypothetical protein
LVVFCDGNGLCHNGILPPRKPRCQGDPLLDVWVTATGKWAPWTRGDLPDRKAPRLPWLFEV